MDTPFEHQSFLQRLWLICRPHLLLSVLGIFLGLVLGFLVYRLSPVVYQAKGTFLINQLPFGLGNDDSSDPETSRQMVQSLILSMSSEGMRKQVAASLGVPDRNLAYTGHDRPIALSSSQKLSANVEIASTRNSRLGSVTAEATDPAFAARVVDATLDQMEVLNKIVGRLQQIEFRLKINQTEALGLVQEIATVAADRSKFETQDAAMEDYIKNGRALEDFPAFASDATLSNLKTQRILVDSDYASLASQSTGGARLEGKHGELKNLLGQIDEHTTGLARALRASLQIDQIREEGLRRNLAALEKSNALLETLRTTLSRGIGDFNLHDDPTAKADPTLIGEASVVVVVDSAYNILKPVRPVLVIDLALGLMLGLAIGLGISFIRSQFRPATR